jgi:hypothetical protein
MASKAKPDYIDLDKDGNRKEPMKKAATDAKKKAPVKEGLGELADMAERDHEVQMARADLYKIAKYAIKLHDLLKNVSEAEGIEGWQQAKITKASDYLSSVFHSLEYDKKVEPNIQMDPMAMAQAAKESTDPYKSRLHSKLAEHKLTTVITKAAKKK